MGNTKMVVASYILIEVGNSLKLSKLCCFQSHVDFYQLYPYLFQDF